MRIDQVLMQYGGIRPSEVKKVLRQRRVAVDGKDVLALNYQVDSGIHQVTLDQQRIDFPSHRYWMLNKAVKTLSANSDAALPVVFDALPETIDRKGLYIIGRLDFLSEGLLLITDNGKLGRNLLKPEAKVEKVYQVVVKEVLTADDVVQFSKGLVIDGHVTLAPAKLVLMSEHTALVTISQGKNRQIRKMFLSVGKLVTQLVRKQMGPISLDPSLQPGEFRALSQVEIQALSPYFN
jgi:16S rRNA pseudouridine516 synthase